MKRRVQKKRELQEQALDDGPMAAWSGTSRWAQKRAQRIREQAAMQAAQGNGQIVELLSDKRVG